MRRHRHGQAHVVGLRALGAGHQRVAAARQRVGGQELELADLVSAEAERGQVVALEPDLGAAEELAQPVGALERRRELAEPDARQEREQLVGTDQRRLQVGERHQAREPVLVLGRLHPHADAAGQAILGRADPGHHTDDRDRVEQSGKRDVQPQPFTHVMLPVSADEHPALRHGLGPLDQVALPVRVVDLERDRTPLLPGLRWPRFVAHRSRRAFARVPGEQP